MAIELRALPRFTFPSKTGGPQTQALTVGFATLPRSAVAAINGFSIGYTNRTTICFEKRSMLVRKYRMAPKAPRLG